MAFASGHHSQQHYGKQQPSFSQHSSFPMGSADDDFLMGGSVASCEAQVQLGFLRKVRRFPLHGIRHHL